EEARSVRSVHRLHRLPGLQVHQEDRAEDRRDLPAVRPGRARPPARPRPSGLLRVRALSGLHVHGARAAGEDGGTGRACGRGGLSLTLRATPVPLDGGTSWDELVRAPGRTHLLQSAAWAELKRATGWVPRRFALHDGSRAVGVAQVLLKPL